MLCINSCNTIPPHLKNLVPNDGSLSYLKEPNQINIQKNIESINSKQIEISKTKSQLITEPSISIPESIEIQKFTTKEIESNVDGLSRYARVFNLVFKKQIPDEGWVAESYTNIIPLEGAQQTKYIVIDIDENNINNNQRVNIQAVPSGNTKLTDGTPVIILRFLKRIN